MGLELYFQLCSCFTVPCPGGICCLCVCKSARISTIALDSLLRVLLCSKKKCYVKHEVPLLLLEMFLQRLTCPPETAIASGLFHAISEPGSQAALAAACSKARTCLFLFSPLQCLKKSCVAVQPLTSPAALLGCRPQLRVPSQGPALGEDQSEF